MYKLLDLFSGIGGFSLGLERSGGFETVAFCEIDKYCRRVLAKHWPETPCYADIRQLTGDRLTADGIAVDAICGGFPCQDISTAGRGAGIGGDRSGLWKEYARIIGELRPRVVFVENVAALLTRGLDVVLGDLAALGYDAEWHCISAASIGAPHRRDRIWIVAYPKSEQRIEREEEADASTSVWKSRNGPFCSSEDEDVAYPNRAQCERGSLSGRVHQEHANAFSAGWWRTEPELDRVANGIPNRMDRLKAIGNAVVPQIPELLGRAYLKSMEQHA